MTKEKTCGNCECYRIGRGKYGSGICVSDKSLKHNKDFVLKSDACREFEERRTNDGERS